MKRSFASTSSTRDDGGVPLDLSGYHTSDETDDEGWDLGPPPVAQKPKKAVVDDGDARGHLVTVIKNGKPCQVYASYAHADGTLRGGCHGTCRHQFDDLMAFAPLAGVARTAAKRTRFVAAYDAYKAAFAKGDQHDCATHRATLEALRTTQCSACRNDPGYLSPAVQVCKEWYDAKRREMCARNGGCANPDCPERGPDVWYILTADHGTNPKARNKKTGKPLSLGNYTVWSSHGGVLAMETELRQIESWPCHVCHNLAPTSNSGKRCPDPATMPKGKWDGTELEQKQYHARRKAGIKYPKHQYVDAAKRTIGCCAACKRPVRPGTEAAFDFDHRDESTKAKGGLFRKNGGVGGLVHNHAKAAELPLVRGLLDAEMDKCQLLCKNCHARKTWGYPASTAVF